MKIIENPSLLHKKLAEYELTQIFDDNKQRPFTLQAYMEGEIILREGEEMKQLLYLVEGRLKATSSVETGKSLLLRFNHPLALIGDLELVRHIPVQSQITAVTACLFIALPFDYIYKHEMTNPAFLQELLQHLSYKLQTLTTASRVNLLSSVENRLASYLLSISTPGNEFGTELQTGNIGEMADLLGTTHRHLNRILHDLTEKGVIDKSRRNIRIIDYEKLEEMSQGIRYE
ncbi:Crp/Fnr family transcriptional regulator [Lysinibacillus odysseyi]|uniref:Crp/Fnr family transcriptional regulator n=1 Tax=Lysinibacillus odysseyi 34hs-1 = NBRC 100172 TaxID=1220589 RepID=A0A0A3ITH1_9BACI|nr:Crp/Fnr family transcriptional regulator [Lysinibacillus odysseyi]KGR86173.1 Crp/Fnr family transcriptional regulator [Lysinibacillus odysseyi 34hs-1 = NBRC 100172]